MGPEAWRGWAERIAAVAGHKEGLRISVFEHGARAGGRAQTGGRTPPCERPPMDSPATCPCCGVVVMPEELSYDFDGETVASLTREVAYLRETVARLRAAARTALPAPTARPDLPLSA